MPDLVENNIVRFTAIQEQYLQANYVNLDYRVVSGTGLPMTEVLADIASTYESWVLGYLFEDLNVIRYKLRRYSAPSIFTRANEPGTPNHLRINYDAEVQQDSAASGGRSTGTALPTFAAISAKKVGGGDTFALFNTSVASSDNPDTKFRGGWRISGISESMTKDNQGNELATVAAANWLGTWRSVAEKMREMSLRIGTLGTVYTLRLVVPSFFGRGHTIRMAGAVPKILFRDVTAFNVSKYLGSQVTRKQRERFQ